MFAKAIRYISSVLCNISQKQLLLIVIALLLYIAWNIRIISQRMLDNGDLFFTEKAISSANDEIYSANKKINSIDAELSSTKSDIRSIQHDISTIMSDIRYLEIKNR